MDKLVGETDSPRWIEYGRHACICSGLTTECFVVGEAVLFDYSLLYGEIYYQVLYFFSSAYRG